jgi:hypothetical protein
VRKKNGMKFFETNKQFHIMIDGENAPTGTKIYELDFELFSSTIELEEFNLKLKSWKASYPDSVELSLCYKGIWFKSKKLPLNKILIINFLNSLKLGNYETKIRELMVDGFQNETNYCINANLNE